MVSPRTIRTLGVLDVALVVALLVAAVAYLTNDGHVAAGTPPTQQTSARQAGQTPAPTAPADFALPSGNIGCAMTVDGVTCTIASITYKGPKVEGCSGTTGHVMTLGAQGARWACVDGKQPAVAGAGTPVLQYGATQTVGDYTCASSTDGVECTNSSGQGFRLARASWATLP
jgi:hypothetical protein